MAGNKIVDINPEKRLTKEFLQQFQEHVNQMTVESTHSVFAVYETDEGFVCEAPVIDWALIGILQAYVDNIRSRMLDDLGG